MLVQTILFEQTVGQAILLWSIGPYWKPVFKGTIILQLPDQPWGW